MIVRASFLISLGLVLCGCLSDNSYMAAPPDALAPHHALHNKTHNELQVVDLREVLNIVIPEAQDIMAITFTKNNEGLFILDGVSGMVYFWDMSSSIASQHIDLGLTNLEKASFSEDGALLAVISKSFVRVWNIEEKTQYLQDVPSEYLAANNMALSSDSRWLGVADQTSGISLWDLTSNKIAFSTNTGDEPKDDLSLPQVTAISFDPTSEWIAYGNDVGYIQLNEWQEGKHGAWSLHGPEETSSLSLNIDNTRNYLAAVTPTRILVWDIQSWWGTAILDLPLLNDRSATVRFSPEGQLLVVATSGGWQIWSLQTRKILIEHDISTYATAFSADGKLFAWGDVEGVVHIWGVPQP